MQTTLGLVAIVEDDAPMRRSIERLLRASGYATAAFGSAEEFLHSGLAGQALGLVLDLHLPGMSGIELRRRLQADGATLPVVCITAFDDEATHNEALAAGCAACLDKPFEAQQLIQALHQGVRT